MARKYSRKELISICEAAVVPEKRWHDRDSASAHGGVGRAWAYLKAGCPFEVLYEQGPTALRTDEDTIWIRISILGFAAMEDGRDEEQRDFDNVYLPTRKKLKEAKGGDWY